ncbi:hypothetical protein [Frankia sp. AiPa1]|uniref:hypothetical protein n=1 Tax=Frankia sp. AiPa1 TaxID=573492 RepID=UPI00202B2683|nr:hypothetical protein [Frankia sp. AiPa1]MCL9759921.1 hypothetical protein [Frankia sp. AiPa1]
MSGAAALAAGLAIAAAALSTWALAVVVAVEQMALAWAWGRTLRASPGTIPLIAGWSLIGDLSLMLTHGHPYHSVVGVVGTGVAAVIVYQLALRRAVTLRAPAATTGVRGATEPPRPATPDAVTAASDAVTAAPDGASARETSTALVAPSDRVSAELVTALSGIVLGLLFTGYLALRAGPDRAGHDLDQPADMLAIAGLLGAGVAVVVGRLAGWSGLPPPAAGSLGALVAAGAGAGLGGLGPGQLSVGAALAAAAAGAVTAGLVNLVLVRARGDVSVSGSGAGRAVDASSTEISSTEISSTETSAAEPPAAEPPGAGAPGAMPGHGGPASEGQRRGATVAAALLGAVVPLACAAPLVYLVGRHLPG